MLPVLSKAQRRTKNAVELGPRAFCGGGEHHNARRCRMMEGSKARRLWSVTFAAWLLAVSWGLRNCKGKGAAVPVFHNWTSNKHLNSSARARAAGEKLGHNAAVAERGSVPGPGTPTTIIPQ